MSRMSFTFSTPDFNNIGQTLGVMPKEEGQMVRYELSDPASGRKLALEIQPEVRILNAENLSLVTVFASNAFLQLQGCTGFIASEELGEVIFFARRNGATNGLVVEKGAGCSLYANVEDALLNADFTQLPPEVMMSSVALSMTEDLFNDLG